MSCLMTTPSSLLIQNLSSCTCLTQLSMRGIINKVKCSIEQTLPEMRYYIFHPVQITPLTSDGKSHKQGSQPHNFKHAMNITTLLIAVLMMLVVHPDRVHAQRVLQLQPGIALSFDDTHIHDWYEANEIFREYGWKATFYLSRFHRFSDDEIAMLHRLQDEGHEIAAHGYHHIRGVEYISENGIQAYLDYEINPMMDIMEQNNFFPTTFAYPYGNRDAQLDSLLFDRFRLLRGTTSGNPEIEYFRGFYNGSNLVFGRGIDSHRDDFDMAYLLSLLEYAKEHNKIVVLFGHKTVPMFTDRNQTEYRTLRALFDYMKEHDMRFYTMDELSSLNSM